MKHPADWMSAPGAETQVVVTSRVRLARNLSDHPFPGWARKKERKAAFELMRPLVEDLKVMKNAFSQEFSELELINKQVLVERHLISREQAARAEGSGAVINRKQTASLMLNEEDHLRIQAMRPGLRLQEAYELANEIDRHLEQSLAFAYDENWGYLTACPSNLGTGMRASAMLHLPGLVMSDQVGSVLKGVDKLGLAVRGLYGEGTSSLGNLFQISNQSTLGESEEDIVGQLSRVIADVALYEAEARQRLFEDDPAMLEDQIGRAYGILRYAHILNSKEALNLLSLLRLGADFEFFPVEVVELCDALLMEIQPAHLQWRAGNRLGAEERDALRAEIIRERLQSTPEPANDLEDNNNLTENEDSED
ncbi:MAG: protein arginine kinase [Verrucomicrobiales bacterium]